MTVSKPQPASGQRRMLMRGLLLVLYAAVMALSFLLGKGHTLLIDNKDSEDGSVKAIESLTISVDGGEPMEFMSGDRDMVKVRAQWHTVEVTVNGQKTQKKITLPVGQDLILVSIPKLLAGVEPSIIPFIPKEDPPPAAEPSGNENAFTSPDGAPPAP